KRLRCPRHQRPQSTGTSPELVRNSGSAASLCSLRQVSHAICSLSSDPNLRGPHSPATKGGRLAEASLTPPSPPSPPPAAPHAPCGASASSASPPRTRTPSRNRCTPC